FRTSSSRQSPIFGKSPHLLILLVVGEIGGRGGIRTHGAVTRTPDFESGAFNHSATLPLFLISLRISLIPNASNLPFRYRHSILFGCAIAKQKKQRQKSAAGKAVARGRITFGDALQ